MALSRGRMLVEMSLNIGKVKDKRTTRSQSVMVAKKGPSRSTQQTGKTKQTFVPAKATVTSIEDTAIATEEIVVPPTDQTEIPPTEQTVIPPTEEAVIPPTEQTVIPPTEQTVIPPTKEAVIPPTEQTVIRPTKQTVIPPTKEAVIPPTEQTVIPPTEEAVIPPTEQTVIPPTKEAVIPPTEQTVIPPTKEAVIPPTEQTVIPPTEQTVIPPTEQTVVPPTEQTVIPPTEEAVIPPTEEAVIPPTKEAVIPPTEQTVIPPTKEAVIPPTEEAVIPPTEEAVIPPTEEAVIPPTEEAVIPPTEEAVIPPTEEAVIPPTEQTVIPPTEQTIIPPTEKADVPPTSTEELMIVNEDYITLNSTSIINDETAESLFAAMQSTQPDQEICESPMDILLDISDQPLELFPSVDVIVSDSPDNPNYNMDESTDEATDTEDSDYAPNDEEPPTKKAKSNKSKIAKPVKEHPPMKEACDSKCAKKCRTKISETERKIIWEKYWQLNYNNQRDMIFNHVCRKTKDRQTPGADHDSRRNMTYTYTLRTTEIHTVCKTFFLGTLGYHPKNDRIISTVMKATPLSALVVTKDLRGCHPPKNKLSRDPIRAHIETFHPEVSHYRREHAPNRRYLPSDVTIKFMYEDFILKHPDFKVKYDTYRKTVAEMKISFTKLGEEMCERCTEFEIHLTQSGHTKPIPDEEEDNENHENCEECNKWCAHIRGAKVSREAYRKDTELDGVEGTCVRSVDLQKVVMLPRMPGNKTAVFTKRIVAYHETFAAVGKKDGNTKKRSTVSVVWHEGMAGRKCEEISSAYMLALEKDRDEKCIILWLDNCTAQNKNWSLLTSLVYLINSDRVATEVITLKFFQAGHTFMSADSIHHGVEREFKNRENGNVLDFADFVDVVKTSNSGKMEVVVLENEKVFNLKGEQSQHKLRKAKVLLHDMSVIEMRRGERSLFYKCDHNDEEFVKLDFLKTNFKLRCPRLYREQARGIPKAKKDDIIAKLCPMMPTSRKRFWLDMPVGVEVDE